MIAVKIDPPFNKELLDWYEHRVYKLRSNAHDLEPMLDEEYKKLNSQGERDAFKALVYQYQHYNLLHMAHVYEEMNLVMMMVNALSIVVSMLPDKQEYKAIKSEMAKRTATITAELAKSAKVARVQNALWDNEINEADRKHDR